MVRLNPEKTAKQPDTNTRKQTLPATDKVHELND